MIINEIFVEIKKYRINITIYEVKVQVFLKNKILNMNGFFS